MKAFMTNVTFGDIVNVRLSLTPGDPPTLHRARVLRVNTEDGTYALEVEMSNGEKSTYSGLTSNNVLSCHGNLKA